MVPQFDADGLLPPGIHWGTWDEVVSVFGNTPWRRQLLAGLEMAIESLRLAGCRTVYVDGSFVTSKEIPNDFDACWEEAGVVPEMLDPVLLRFDAGRAAQKARYLGELFPASIGATADGISFLEFFQTDRGPEGPRVSLQWIWEVPDDQERTAVPDHPHAGRAFRAHPAGSHGEAGGSR